MSLQAMLAQTQEERNTIAEEYKKTISELTLRQKKVDTATVEERLHNSEIAKNSNKLQTSQIFHQIKTNGMSCDQCLTEKFHNFILL